jgi:hypothetical protein
MMKHLALAAALVFLSVAPALAADNAIVLTPGTGVTERSKDVGSGVQSVIVIPGDTSGNPLATAPGTGNTSFALPMQGVAGGVAMPVSGTFWQTTQPVSGTFWPYSLGQQVSGSSVPVVLPAAQITTLTPPAWSNTNQIGNTGFNALQGGAANAVGNPFYVAPGTGATFTVSNGGTFAVQATLQASATTAIGKVDPNTIGNWGLAASTQNGSTPTNGGLVMGQFNTSPTTITNGNISPLQLDNAGNLLVNIKAGAGSGGTALADGSTFTIGTTNETPMGCTYVSGGITVTTGKASIVTCTSTGSLHTTVDNTNANGSATSANSSPVVIASDQAAVAIKAASASIASGAIASGALASGSISSGAFASGSVSSGAFVSGALASGAVVDLTNITGSKGAGTAAADSLLAGGVYNSTAPTLTNGQQASLQLGPHGGLMQGGAGYSAGATPETISTTGTTAATTATLAAASGVTTYICGFSIRANATAAATGNATVTGTITGTLNFTQWTAPLASGLGVTEEIFTPCIPASTTNTSIAVVSAAPGSGGTVSVTAWGFQL